MADGPQPDVAPTRRRPTVLLLGGLVVVALGLVVIAFAVATAHRAAPLLPRPPTSAGAGDPPCAAAPAEPDATRIAHSYGALSPGAVSVRLCNTNDLGGGVPPDVLTTRVTELTDLINGLPRLAPDAACTADLGPHVALLVDYSDGTRSVAAAELDGCQAIIGRRGAGQVIDAFLARLLDQRRQIPPPVAEVTPTCVPDHPTSSWLPPAVRSTVRAVWCPADSASSGRVIPAWPQVRDAITAGSVPGQAGGGAGVRGHVVAVSASGETTVLWLGGGTLTWYDRTPSGSVSMSASVPDADIARIVGG